MFARICRSISILICTCMFSLCRSLYDMLFFPVGLLKHDVSLWWKLQDVCRAGGVHLITSSLSMSEDKDTQRMCLKDLIIMTLVRFVYVKYHNLCIYCMNDLSI